METTTILSVLLALLAGLLVYFLVNRPKAKILEETAKREAERIRKTAEDDAHRIVTDGKKQIETLRENTKREENQMRDRLTRMQEQSDERIAKKEDSLEQKEERMNKAREEYEVSVKKLEAKQDAIDKQLGEQNKVLEDLAKLSQDKAKEELFASSRKAMFERTGRRYAKKSRGHGNGCRRRRSEYYRPVYSAVREFSDIRINSISRED